MNEYTSNYRHSVLCNSDNSLWKELIINLYKRYRHICNIKKNLNRMIFIVDKMKEKLFYYHLNKYINIFGGINYVNDIQMKKKKKKKEDKDKEMYKRNLII